MYSVNYCFIFSRFFTYYLHMYFTFKNKAIFPFSFYRNEYWGSWEIKRLCFTEKAQSFKVERHVYILEWCPPSLPWPTKKIINIFGVWQVKDEIGEIRWLKTSNDGNPIADGNKQPDTQGSGLEKEESCFFLLLRQQIYIGLTITRFRKSLAYFNCVQLFFYFFLQF